MELSLWWRGAVAAVSMTTSLILKQFSAATLALYEPGLSSANFVERSLSFLGTLLPTDLSGYGAVDLKSGNLNASFDRNPPGLAPALESFGKLMHQYKPFRFDPSVNNGEPYSVLDFFSKTQFHDLDIYQEVHKPLGFDDHCFVHVPTEPGVILFYGLFRGGGEFRHADKEMLRLAQPHLMMARRLARANDVVSERALTPGIFVKAGFTPRESETTFWLTQGKSNQEIAQLLRVRTDTVSGYLRSIFEKMGVENRVAATVHALSLAQKLHLNEERIHRGEIAFEVSARAIATGR